MIYIVKKSCSIDYVQVRARRQFLVTSEPTSRTALLLLMAQQERCKNKTSLDRTNATTSGMEIDNSDDALLLSLLSGFVRNLALRVGQASDYIRI